MRNNQVKSQPQAAVRITQTTSQPLWQSLTNAQQEVTKGGYRSRGGLGRIDILGGFPW